MPKYQVTTDITIRGYIGPDGYFDLDTSLIEAFEDLSSFSASEPMRFYGGEITFTVDGATDTEARARAEDAIGNYLYFSDSSGIEWEIEEWEITDFTPLEEPLNVDRAMSIVREWLSTPASANAIPREVRDAILFLLDELTQMLLRQMATNASVA